MRKTPAQRIEAYRLQADQIQERERRKLLAKSPEWMATKRALANIQLAFQCLTDGPSSLRTALEDAQDALDEVRLREID